MLAAAAPIPTDFSWLSGLDPGVAITALCVLALGMVLFYLGPGLRDRFRKAPPPPPAAPTGPAIPAVPPALPAAIDQAERVSAQFIAHLQDQVRDLEREADNLRQANTRLQADNERLLWMRGGDPR